MRKTTLFIGITVALFSCIKQSEKTFTGNTVVELDAAVLNATATGVTYPILTRKALHGVPVATTDSTLRRFTGLVRLRINLVGPQSNKDETIGYKIFGSPITSIAFPATATGQTPSQALGTLAVSSAVSGTHFSPLNGVVTIPAKSSFGFIDLQVVNGAATAGQARFLGIQLDSSGTIKPNPNYNKIGLVIDQR
ncbi:MAG: hypothetical protein V4676_06160 [Bacteroidota bacterium]